MLEQPMGEFFNDLRLRCWFVTNNGVRCSVHEEKGLEAWRTLMFCVVT